MPTLLEPGEAGAIAAEATAEGRGGFDLRLPALGVAAWAGGLAGVLLTPRHCLVLGVLAGAVALACRLPRRAAFAWLLVAVAVAGGAILRQDAIAASPATALAAQGAVVEARLTLTTDPQVRRGEHTDYVVVRGRLHAVTGRGASYRLGMPVLVVADAAWHETPLGSTVTFTARAAASDGPDIAAVLRATGPPEVVGQPSALWRATAVVRASLRASVAHLEPAPRTLVPALVVGDDDGMPDALADDFRATGLTHLLTVSGTNLTLVVGFLLITARWAGVRGGWLYLVGTLGIIGFVLLCRTEPSVVRAAAMGSVALIAMGSNGRERGSRALGAAVVGLLLIDPWLSVTAGFALSVLATAGILFLAPLWRDAMMRWLPRWISEAIAVPAAAQVACTPIVAAISEQVSLVAVVTNLIAGPAVAPATVLGLIGAIVGLVSPAAATLLGTLAGWSVGWIIAVARRGGALPSSAVDWGADALSVSVLTALCVVGVLLAPRLLGRRSSGLGCLVLMLVLVAVPLPTVGELSGRLPGGLWPSGSWPPADWAVVACDVGQGDAIVLNAGDGAAVLIDTGLEPEPVARCLRDLRVRSIPRLVLSHYDADHVAGIGGVLGRWPVGEVWATGLREPASGAALVEEHAAEAGVEVRVPVYGEALQVGQIALQVIAPRPGDAAWAGANDASLVLVAEIGGARVLLTGDLEPPGQARMRRTLPDLAVDVLKVPHHGSRHQDTAWLAGLGAQIALVSAGEDNRYGHPAPGLLQGLEASGMQVLRTDLSGDIAVVVGEGGLRAATR